MFRDMTAWCKDGEDCCLRGSARAAGEVRLNAHCIREEERLAFLVAREVLLVGRDALKNATPAREHKVTERRVQAGDFSRRRTYRNRFSEVPRSASAKALACAKKQCETAGETPGVRFRNWREGGERRVGRFDVRRSGLRRDAAGYGARAAEHRGTFQRFEFRKGIERRAVALDRRCVRGVHFVRPHRVSALAVVDDRLRIISGRLGCAARFACTEWSANFVSRHCSCLIDRNVWASRRSSATGIESHPTVVGHRDGAEQAECRKTDDRWLRSRCDEISPLAR